MNGVTGGSSDLTASSGTRTVYGTGGGTRSGANGTNGTGGGAASSAGTPQQFSNFSSFGYGSGYFSGGGGCGNDASGGSGGGGGAGNGGASGQAGADASTQNTGSGGGGGAGGAVTLGGDGASGWIGIRYTSNPFPGAGVDMTLVSNAVTAETANPTKADLVMTYTNGVGTATIGTDLTAEVSRDGSTWTSFGLSASSDQGDTGGHTILTAHDIDISGQPAGSSMQYRIKTLNQSASKETRIHAVSLGWS